MNFGDGNVNPVHTTYETNFFYTFQFQVELRLHAVGDAPIFKRTRWNIDGEKRIEVRANPYST